MWWFRQGTCFLPAFLVVWASGTFIIPYIIAVCNHDVDLLFPYISDTGVNPPQRCVFSLMAVVTACTAMMTMYCRYKFVEKLNEDQQAAVVDPTLNKAALRAGIASCVGMLFVATFQENVKIWNINFTVHYAGALVFFISGGSYTVLQVVISYRACPHGSSLRMCHIRSAVAFITVLAVFPTIIAGIVASANKNYAARLVSTVSEWILVFSFVCFFFTYIHEFKLYTVKVKANFSEQESSQESSQEPSQESS